MNNERKRTADEILAHAKSARLELTHLNQSSAYVDTWLPIPCPSIGSGSIRFAIIGQDPAVQNAVQRSRLLTVLHHGD